MRLSDSFLQELKFKTDIEDIISGYVSLKRRGSTSVGLCPFHNEKTPSFTVYNDTQSYYCFGCGAGGDAVTFIKSIENLDYVDAVKLLAQRAGMQMPQEEFDDSLSKKRRIILEINRAAAKFYYSVLMSDNGKAGLNYYLNRKLTMNTIKKFGLGYAPDEWNALTKHLRSLGYKISDIVEAGLAKAGKNNSYYDFFRNRVMVPVIDVRGNVIAFGGRLLDNGKPKYINTLENIVYKKTYELFGLNLAKDNCSEFIILCEGYMDVIAMNQAGFTNAVACCGTSLTSEQVRLINRYTNEVFLLYDNDEAGRKALSRAINLFSQTDIKVRIPALSGGKDPDEIIKNLGRDKFKGMLEKASNVIEHKMLELRGNANLATTQGKIDFINDAIKILADVSAIEQDIYISRLSDELNVDKSSIKAQLDSYSRKNKKRRERNNLKTIVENTVRDNKKISVQNNASTRLIRAEERIIGLLLRYPQCLDLCDKIDEEKFSSDFIKKIYSFICSRLADSQNVILSDFSGTLSDSEMGRLSGIIARTQESKNPEREILDCTDILNKEYEIKNMTSSADMTDEQFRNLFKKD